MFFFQQKEQLLEFPNLFFSAVVSETEFTVPVITGAAKLAVDKIIIRARSVEMILFIVNVIWLLFTPTNITF